MRGRGSGRGTAGALLSYMTTFLRAFSFATALVGFAFAGLGTGCSPALEGDPGPAPEAATGELTAEVDVNACRRGPSIPMRYESFQSFVRSRYDSTAGTEIAVEPSFNGFESGFEVYVGGALPGADPHDGALDDASIESCAGRLRILPHARIRFSGAPPLACKPLGIADGSCELKDGTLLQVITYLAAQSRGFKVAATDLNIRVGPSTNDAILETLAKDTVVRVTGDLVDGFRSVSVGGKSGWAHRDYLVDFSGTAVASTSLRLRQWPSLSAPVVQMISPGETVVVDFGAVGQFHRVSLGGVSGWASGEWLEDPVRSP